jgi:hydroxypyruvate isomerase
MMPEQEPIAMTTPMTRRSALGRVAGAAFLSATTASLAARLTAAGVQLNGRVRHSVCKWCYPKVSLDDLCREGKTFGLTSVELLEVKDFETLKKHDMVCAMVSGVPGGSRRA